MYFWDNFVLRFTRDKGLAKNDVSLFGKTETFSDEIKLLVDATKYIVEYLCCFILFLIYNLNNNVSTF